MESAGVAQLKARLSEYLSRVKAGEEVLVTDRGRPVARLVPVGAGYAPDNEAELARLREMEREGLVRLGSGRLPEGFFEKERPADPGGILRKAVLEEREEGR
ncbi:MAG TPA: type II toxin-antitoxin system prevent-host-death family antitoxin [Rubrobacteraceae bacterium]|jgi:prevent-host-death family protein|nr:type II toxin-antitoxin system prevent-host-death family antitoxin [Rubrobacteraceae bacterium]